MEFIKCDKNQPDQTGYYMTWYFNPKEHKLFLKAICWHYGQGWVQWNSNYKPQVIGFIKESRSDFYTQCIEWYDTNYKERGPDGKAADC
jgi:hypothetical protein